MLEGVYPDRMRCKAVEEPKVPPPPTTITFVVVRDVAIMRMPSLRLLVLRLRRSGFKLCYLVANSYVCSVGRWFAAHVFLVWIRNEDPTYYVFLRFDLPRAAIPEAGSGPVRK